MSETGQFRPGEPQGSERASKTTQENLAEREDEAMRREKNLDKTIEDSFPDSDPPSTIPNPA